MEALRVADLRRSFGALDAVAGVSFEVQQGERRALIGPNGAGKTTLFNLISGELPPTSGEVFLLGQNVTHMPVYRRVERGLSRTFQRNNLLLGLTVLENVRLAVQGRARIAGNLVQPWDRFSGVIAASEDILERVGLADQAQAVARNLGYGQQRQLELAVALGANPRVLLLDEPSAGISPAETEHMTRLIAGMPRELTILIIEHDMDVVFALADRITVLHYGQVLAEGKPEDVRANRQVHEVYLGSQESALP